LGHLYGKFIGFLYDAVDEDLANRELAYRDSRGWTN
jgi:hypothetical protein